MAKEPINGIEAITVQSTEMFDSIQLWLDTHYVNGSFEKGTVVLIVIAATVVLSAIAYFLVRFTIVTIIHRFAKKTKTTWDNFFVKRKLFSRLAHIAPAIVIFFSAEFVPLEYDVIPERIAYAYLAIVMTLAASSIISATSDVYNSKRSSASNPVQPFVQMIKLFIFIIGFIFAISALMGEDPWRLVAGFGALTAVLLLVFKDSILGLVASIQFLVNDLVKQGDWIEVPSHGADGIVIDIQLTTIKVQNWDNTITSFPTYSLISNSFKNWRGMQDSDGRQVKRSIFLDMNSIQFCTPEMVERFQNSTA